MVKEQMTDKQLVERLCEIDSDMSEWEVGFVESIASWVKDKERSLTTKQRARAWEIYVKHC